MILQKWTLRIGRIIHSGNSGMNWRRNTIPTSKMRMHLYFPVVWNLMMMMIRRMRRDLRMRGLYTPLRLSSLTNPSALRMQILTQVVWRLRRPRQQIWNPNSEHSRVSLLRSVRILIHAVAFLAAQLPLTVSLRIPFLGVHGAKVEYNGGTRALLRVMLRQYDVQSVGIGLKFVVVALRKGMVWIV